MRCVFLCALILVSDRHLRNRRHFANIDTSNLKLIWMATIKCLSEIEILPCSIYFQTGIYWNHTKCHCGIHTAVALVLKHLSV